jgi:hypothetical protein
MRAIDRPRCKLLNYRRTHCGGRLRRPRWCRVMGTDEKVSVIRPPGRRARTGWLHRPAGMGAAPWPRPDKAGTRDRQPVRIVRSGVARWPGGSGTCPPPVDRCGLSFLYSCWEDAPLVLADRPFNGQCLPPSVSLPRSDTVQSLHRAGIPLRGSDHGHTDHSVIVRVQPSAANAARWNAALMRR